MRKSDALAAVFDQSSKTAVVPRHLFFMRFAPGKSGRHRAQQAGSDAVMFTELLDPHRRWSVRDLHPARQLDRAADATAQRYRLRPDKGYATGADVALSDLLHRSR